ncbi:MAG TPA: ester cyclase [Gemmataceae bacterium]|nr:ester cyclase [Gemmataceae bacterium]
MSNATDNKAQSERWFEDVWNQRRTACIFEMLLADAVGHLEHGDAVGPEPFAAVHAAFLAAFPDLKITVEGIVAEGDDVVVRWSATGMHRGEFLGVAATGKAVSFRGMTWHRYRDGKLFEGWDSWNVGGLMQHLKGE